MLTHNVSLGEPITRLKCANFAALDSVRCEFFAGLSPMSIQRLQCFNAILHVSWPGRSEFTVVLAQRYLICSVSLKETNTTNTKVKLMKNLLIGLGALLVLTMVTTDAIAQRGLGNGGGQSRGSGGSGIQTRAGNQGQVGQSQNGNERSALQHGNQIRQTPGVLSNSAGGSDLLRMREEEKLARDVYTSLAKTSKLSIFQNISRAESQHMQSIERLIRSGGANAGNLNDAPGVFVFPEYQQLYTTLIASGTRSPLDALMVGARIEEMDIADLRQVLTQTTDPQVRQVLERLMQGSQNHLRAFATQIASQGASYNAQFLTQTEFDQIANSSGQGRGQQSAGHGANNRGQGSQASGQQLGPQFQGSPGQGFDTQNRNGQQYRSGRGNAGLGGGQRGR